MGMTNFNIGIIAPEALILQTHFFFLFKKYFINLTMERNHV